MDHFQAGDEFSWAGDLIPEGAVPVAGIRIVSVAMPDGRPEYAFDLEGDASLPWVLGHMIAVAFDALHDRDHAMEEDEPR